MSETTNDKVCVQAGCWHSDSSHATGYGKCLVEGCQCMAFAHTRETMPSDRQAQAVMSDDVFYAWSGYELQGAARASKTAQTVLEAFAQALQGKKVLVGTPKGNIVIQPAPVEPEPEIVVDDEEARIAERVRGVEQTFVRLKKEREAELG